MTTNQEPDIIHQQPRRHRFSRKETFGYGIAALNLVASLIQIGTFVFSSTHPETQHTGSASNSFFTTAVSATLAASLFMNWLALFWFAVRVATLKRLKRMQNLYFKILFPGCVKHVKNWFDNHGGDQFGGIAKGIGLASPVYQVAHREAD